MISAGAVFFHGGLYADVVGVCGGLQGEAGFRVKAAFLADIAAIGVDFGKMLHAMGIAAVKFRHFKHEFVEHVDHSPFLYHTTEISSGQEAALTLRAGM